MLGEVAARSDLSDPRFFAVYFGTELVLAHHLAGRHDEALRVANAFGPITARMSEALEGMWPATLALARAGSGATETVMPELLELFRRARRDTLPVIAHYILTVMAAVLALRGDDEAASTVLAAAGTELALPFRTPGHYAVYRHYGRILHRRLGDEVARRCRSAGARLSLDAAAKLAREVAETI